MDLPNPLMDLPNPLIYRDMATDGYSDIWVPVALGHPLLLDTRCSWTPGTSVVLGHPEHPLSVALGHPEHPLFYGLVFGLWLCLKFAYGLELRYASDL